MGQGLFASNVLQALLSWLQSLFSGLWSIMSGANGGSMIRWLSENWKTMLVCFIIFGIAIDIIVYMLRWRPYWWWFGKKRLIIDDELLEDDVSHARRASKPQPTRASKPQPTRANKPQPAGKEPARAQSEPKPSQSARKPSFIPRKADAPARAVPTKDSWRSYAPAPSASGVTRDSIFDIVPVKHKRADSDADRLYAPPKRANRSPSKRSAQ